MILNTNITTNSPPTTIATIKTNTKSNCGRWLTNLRNDQEATLTNFGNSPCSIF